MAVTSVVEYKSSGGVDENNYRHYTRKWLIRCNDPADGPLTASTAVSLTLWSSYYQSGNDADTTALLKSIEVQPNGGDDHEIYLWEMTANYDNKPFQSNAIANQSGSMGTTPTAPSSPTPSGGTAPASRPWSVKFGVRQTEEYLTEDKNGLDAVASNGQPFEGGLQAPKAVPYFTLTCYTTSPNYSKVGQYVNTCNNAMFLGFNTYTLRCTDYQISTQYEQGYGYFYQKDITFEINNDGWDLKVLNVGTHKWDATNGCWIPLMDHFGKEATAPLPLNAAGAPIAPGGAFSWQTFQIYSLTNFSNIL